MMGYTFMELIVIHKWVLTIFIMGNIALLSIALEWDWNKIILWAGCKRGDDNWFGENIKEVIRNMKSIRQEWPDK